MSRLFWFLVGASFGTYWADRHREGGRGSMWCQTFGQHQPQRIEGPDDSGRLPNSSDSDRKRRACSAPPTPLPSNSAAINWEIEAERMRRQATDAAADLTEATVVTLQNTLESLRTKIHQHKVQRDALRQQEAEHNSLPRKV